MVAAYRRKPTIRGSRIAVELILECLAEGMSPQDICHEYGIELGDVRAAVRYAHAVLAGEDTVAVAS